MATILLVDSELKDLERMESLLRGFGHEVIARAEGFSAMTVIKNKTPIDTVITEYRFSGMQGRSFLEILKRYLPNIPVIVLARHGSIEDYLQCMSCGAYEFVLKPAHEEIIRHVVMSAVKGRASHLVNRWSVRCLDR